MRKARHPKSQRSRGPGQERDPLARVGFIRACAEVLWTIAPYWVLWFLVVSICHVVGSATLTTLCTLVGLYLVVGGLVVFGYLRDDSCQESHRIDIPGAAVNIYLSAWWPWYLWTRRDRR